MDVNWCSPNFYYDTLEWINCFNALICCLFVYTRTCAIEYEKLYLPLHAFFMVLTIKTSNSILIRTICGVFFIFNIEVLILLLQNSSYVYLNWNFKWTKEEPVFISLWIDVIIMCKYENREIETIANGEKEANFDWCLWFDDSHRETMLLLCCERMIWGEPSISE